MSTLVLLNWINTAGFILMAGILINVEIFRKHKCCYCGVNVRLLISMALKVRTDCLLAHIQNCSNHALIDCFQNQWYQQLTCSGEEVLEWGMPAK